MNGRQAYQLLLSIASKNEVVHGSGQSLPLETRCVGGGTATTSCFPVSFPRDICPLQAQDSPLSDPAGLFVHSLENQKCQSDFIGTATSRGVSLGHHCRLPGLL